MKINKIQYTLYKGKDKEYAAEIYQSALRDFHNNILPETFYKKYDCTNRRSKKTR